MFAAEGLRTLVTAYKDIPPDMYSEWEAKYKEARYFLPSFLPYSLSHWFSPNKRKSGLSHQEDYTSEDVFSKLVLQNPYWMKQAHIICSFVVFFFFFLTFLFSRTFLFSLSIEEREELIQKVSIYSLVLI